MNMDKIEQLQKMIDESNNIVVFSGAGVSTESGIKDFRSDDGLYNILKDKYQYQPEYMLSSAFFYKNTLEFYKFYKETFNCLNVKPNLVHNYFKLLEDKAKLKAIITQNIDGLHTKAGCHNVYEIHGTIYKNYCNLCNHSFTADYVFNSNGIPRCKCGGIVKPSVVLYGEMLPSKEYNSSLLAINKADMLIIVGTSLTVYPACEMINLFHGKYLVIINKDKTQYDNKANLVIHDKLGNVFDKLK